MAELLMPNMLATLNQGIDRGRGNRFAQLAGQAYSAAPAQQNALIGQAVSVDPTAGLQLGSQLATLNGDRQKTAQAAEVDHNKKLRGAAQFALDALKSRDPARIQGAGNAVGPYLTQLTGKQFPGLSEDMLPALYQVLAQTGGADETKGVVLSAGGQLRNPMTGELLADNPQSLQYHDVPMGEGKAAGVFDPSTGTIRPAVGGAAQPGPQGAPQGDPMQPFIDQANHAVQLGADPAKVEAWLQQQAQQIGAQPQAPGQSQPAAQAPAQFGVGTPKPSAADQESFGAPQQVMGADGKPHLVQFGNRGGQREVSGFLKPEMTPAQAAKQAVQQQKAEASKADALESYDQSISQIDNLLNSPGASMLGTYTGDVAGMFPHTDTSNANAALDNIKNQVLLNTISKLKALSATGASGFGSLSNQEGEILKNSIASLDRKQTNAQLMQNLRNIKSMLQQSRNNVAGKQVEFDAGQGAGQAPQIPPQAGGVDDLLSKYGVQ